MKTCARCGDKILPSDYEEPVFETRCLSKNPDHSGKWVFIFLCNPCQEDLRNEFYDRGLVDDGPEEEN